MRTQHRLAWHSLRPDRLRGNQGNDHFNQQEWEWVSTDSYRGLRSPPSPAGTQPTQECTCVHTDYVVQAGEPDDGQAEARS